jgi:hypothetical protein
MTGVVPGGGTAFKGLPAGARCKVPSPSGRCVGSCDHDGTSRDLTMSAQQVVCPRLAFTAKCGVRPIRTDGIIRCI